MDRKDFLELAGRASQGNRAALARFRDLALAARFVGGPGGWIRLGDQPGARNVCQGWAALAKRASQSGWVLTHFVDAGIISGRDLVEVAAERTGTAGVAHLAAVADAVAAQGDLPGMWEDSDLHGGEADTEDAMKDLGAGLYALEVLKPVSGVARVAVLRDDQRVQVFHGDTALMDATSAMIRYNAGTDSPPEPVEPSVHPGDVVTIHRGVRRYMVGQVQLDSFQNGERCDYARVTPCAPEDDREPQWVAMDLLHVVKPAGRLTTTVRNGILVTEELVELYHHTAGLVATKRVALVQDPSVGAAGMTALLVDPRFPEGTPVHRNASAEIPTLFPGDAVVVERPSGNALYRWLPDMADADAVLVNMTYADRHAWAS
jgi:hypothetical protein